jgi:hypothetical protein
MRERHEKRAIWEVFTRAAGAEESEIIRLCNLVQKSEIF